MLSRNTPVALVVGAAGFLGSHLTEKLLIKKIQVIGVDDFSEGKKEHLEEAIKNRDFHLIEQNAENLSFEVERLDYIFIVAGEDWNIGKVLNIAKKYGSKLVFVSSIELYDRKGEGLNWYKNAESRIASFAPDNKLNARVLRLAFIYGPRMHFKSHDPASRLIYSAILGEIQKESTVLEFSTRALYIDDAVDLVIKSMLVGSTAQKIFDGALLVPIKVAEFKQVLMDPKWYETRGFIPSELPPWPTPNLEKTIKFLSWDPKNNVVKGINETVDYFKKRGIKVEQIEEVKESATVKFFEQQGPKREFKEEEPKPVEKDSKPPSQISPSERRKVEIRKFFSLTGILGMIAGLIILYALIWPIGASAWQVYSFKQKLNTATILASKGEFDKSLKSLAEAREGIREIGEYVNIFSFIRQFDFFEENLGVLDALVYQSDQTLQGAEQAIKGTNNLYQGFKAVTGEITDESEGYFVKASSEFAKADADLSKAEALLARDNLSEKIPKFLEPTYNTFEGKLKEYSNLVQKGRAVSAILPEVLGKDSKKSYLVLLQNNNELRPTGGFIGSYAKIDFEGGKLKKLEVNDIYSLDGALSIHVEPPKEIKNILGQKDWFLRDSNWEPDFPTAARQAEWFFNQASGSRVDGVVALDLSAIEDLLLVNGPIMLTDYDETVTADNLFEKSVTYAEQGFFPGSQAKKNFLTALTNQLFNKLFFLPNQNWPGIVGSLGRSLEQKHLMFYLDNPKLFSYMVSQNWAGAMPRPNDKNIGETDDFLSLVEANLGANKSNYYIERSYDLETTIGKEGEINHRLKVDYINRSPSEVWPAGKYKNFLRVYLPFGARLVRGLFGQTDITSNISAFADYGRAGYSMLLEINPKENKTLVLDYQLSGRLGFKDDQALYRLNVIKQAGIREDPFEWKLTYPINYSIDGGKKAQEHTISTDLSEDRSFEVNFKK